MTLQQHKAAERTAELIEQKQLIAQFKAFDILNYLWLSLAGKQKKKAKAAHYIFKMF